MAGASLSVIMCNYNYGRYLGGALNAVTSQSRKPDQFIVVDDGSTDDSVAIIEEAARRHPFVKLLRNDRNRGVTYTVNRGLENVTGDYISFQSSDDLVLPGFIEKTMGMLEKHPQAALCCSYPSTLEDETGEIRDYVMDWGEAPSYFPPDRLTDLFRRGTIAGNACVLKRRTFHEVGGFRPDLRWHCDWFPYMVMAFRYGICYVPERLAVIRVHKQSYSAAGMKRWGEQRAVLHRILDLLHSPEYRDLLPMFIASGSLTRSFRWGLIRAVMCYPRYWRPSNFRLVFHWYQLERQLRRRIPFAGRKRL